MSLTHLSLFSGIGGIDLAAEWAGFKTIAFCEKDKFCQKVLRKHWPNTPIHEDVKELSGKSFRGITVLSGGFPCQPFSASGKRKGKEDSRYLWPEMLRVISEARPAWVVGENVAGLLSLSELEDILLSLEGADYELWPIVLPACSVGAPHVRNRIFILAHSRSSDDNRRPVTENNGKAEREIRRRNESNVFAEQIQFDVANTDEACSGNAETRSDGKTNRQELSYWIEGRPRTQPDWTRSWAEVASALCRVDDGVPKGLDKRARIGALGNAVVPQHIYPVFRAIADIELGVVT